MYAVGVAAALVLFGVFLTASATKLADLGGARQAVEEFGAPRAIAIPFGTLLPLLELGAAALLLFSATAFAGALAAAALLALFSVAIGLNLARGRTPECHCFGQVRSAPAGWPTLARNAALLVVAVIGAAALAGEPEASAVSWLDRIDPNAAALLLAGAGLLAAALAAWGMLHVLRAHGRLLLRIDQLEAALSATGIEIPVLADPEVGIPTGSEAPDFALPDLERQSVSRDDLLSPGLPLLVVFTEAGCGPCRELLPEIAAWQEEESDRLTIAIAAAGSPEDVRAAAGEHGLGNILLDEDRALFDAYRATATPSAVLIASDATAAAPLAIGPQRIRALRARAHGPAAGEGERGPKVGEPLPRLELPLLDGGTVDLGAPKGKGSETALLFWNPGCGYCRQMHRDLLRWERNGANKDLIVISSGNEADVRREQFRSPVVLDPEFSVSQRFGASGTPMALLLDAEGRVASPLAGGKDRVTQLIQAEVAL